MFEVRADFRPISRRLDDLAKRQVPFAAARALNDTAQVAANAVRKEMPRIFDRPTPFTKNAIGVERATKQRLQARVFVKDRQAEYLEVQEIGGTRQPKKKALVIPEQMQLNQHGNMPRRALQIAKARKNTFIGTVRGVGGLWQRPDRGKRRNDGGNGTKGALNSEHGFKTGLKLLVRFVAKAAYKPAFGFRKKVNRTAAAVLPTAFRQSLAKALATARR